jgi:hypothetical protein
MIAESPCGDLLSHVHQRSVPNMLSAAQVAEHYFLESRHMLLEIAAHFDRYDAAAAREAGGAGHGGTALRQGADGRMTRLREAIAILAEPHADRERTVTLLELFARD